MCSEVEGKCTGGEDGKGRWCGGDAGRDDDGAHDGDADPVRDDGPARRGTRAPSAPLTTLIWGVRPAAWAAIRGVRSTPDRAQWWSPRSYLVSPRADV